MTVTDGIKVLEKVKRRQDRQMVKEYHPHVKELTLYGKSIIFEQRISAVFELEDRSVVVLDDEGFDPDDPSVRQNVFCYDNSGKFLWRIQDMEESWDSDGRPMGIMFCELDRNGTIILENLHARYSLNPFDGTFFHTLHIKKHDVRICYKADVPYIDIESREEVELPWLKLLYKEIEKEFGYLPTEDPFADGMRACTTGGTLENGGRKIYLTDHVMGTTMIGPITKNAQSDISTMYTFFKDRWEDQPSEC